VPNLPVVLAQVNNQDVGGWSRAWDINMAFNKHTYAELDILYPGPFSSTASINTYTENSPIKVSYGTPPYIETFYGYVNHSELISPTGASNITMRYGLIGTSQPMNNQHTRSWKSTSASAIARQIAQQQGFRSIISSTDRVLDYWAQSGESDLQLLDDLAAESGFRFWVDGSTLTFIDPELLLTGTIENAVPVFTYNRSAGTPDTLTDFNPVTGQNVPGQGIQANRMIHGVDSRTGQPFKYSTNANANIGVPSSTTTPYINKVITDQYVRNYGQAKAVLDATSNSNRDWAQADVAVLGTPRLKPGYLVNLQGSALPSDSSGLWQVIAARHVIVPSRVGSGTTALNASYLTISRNQIDNVTFNRTKSLTGIGEIGGCYLLKGNWQATTLASYLV
jgi:phage protein D